MYKIMMLFAVSAVPSLGFSLADFMGWYIDNKVFMYFVTGAIFIDHILGSWKHSQVDKDFSWKKNATGLFLKMSVTFMGYILFEMFYQIAQDVEFIALYLKVLLQLVTFMYPASSAFKNSYVLTNGKFPSKGLMKIFQLFEDTADLSTLKTNKNENKEDSVSEPTDSNNAL